MERELWLALYKLVRELGTSPWFSVTKFFRLGDRGRLLVGSGSRSTGKLGVRSGELASGLVEWAVAFAIDHEPSPSNH